MKKIIKLFLFTLLIAILGSENVLAEEFNGVFEKSEKINNIYYYKHRSDTDEIKYSTHDFHEQAYIYRDTIKHNYVYCIESWKHLTGSKPGDYQVYIKNHHSTVLSDEMIEKLNLISYYGYGYVDNNYNHSSSEWYAFTQMLIWRYQAPQYEHYFVNSETSTNAITNYEYYLNQIESLINEHYIKPSIKDNIDIYANEMIALNDDNNVLNYYEVVNNNKDVNVYIDGNKLIIDSNYTTGTYNLKLIRRNNRFNKPMQIYTSENFQNVLEPGDCEPIEINLTINVKPHKLKTAYTDDIFLEEYYDESMHVKVKTHLFEDIKFQIIAAKDVIDKEGNLLIASGDVYTTYTTFNGYNEIELPEGNYIIKQQTKISGYKMQEISVEVKHETTKIIHGERQVAHLEIEKRNEQIDKQGKSYYTPGKNIEIGVYAAEDIYNFLGGIFAKKDTLLYKYKTDSQGEIQTILYELQPGKYYYKEMSEVPGYEKNEIKYPFSFEYSKEFESIYMTEKTIIINSLKRSNVFLIKSDADTKFSLRGVEYSIFNEYENLVFKGITDDSGKIKCNLPLGKYYIKETKALDGYIIDNKTHLVKLTESDYYLKLFNEKISSDEKSKNENKKEDKIDNYPTIIEPTISDDQEKIEIIVDVPKTEKNDYLFFVLFFIIGLEIIIIKCSKKA